MDSDSTVAIGGADRLSKLGDATLGHILSFLPADEAARAAALSRRWRHVFAHVHTVSLDEPEPERNSDDDDYNNGGCYSPGYGAYRNDVQLVPPFVNRVSAALLRRLGGGAGAGAAPGVPLRALRVVFHEFSPRVNAGLVDMWLWHAVQQAGDELHVDLRLCRDLRVCDRCYSLCRGPPVAENTTTTHPLAAAAIDEDEAYVAPRSIFTCAALRTLRLGYCCLHLPPSAAVALPSLDTLHLTGVTGANRAVERLVSSCPRLAALTLEACAMVTALSVLADARLRTLAIRCCHDLAAVVVADASELRVFEYRGAVPTGPSFLTLHGGPLRVSSCTLDFCGEEAMDTLQLAGLSDMLRLFVGVERLQLTSARLGCGAVSPSTSAFPAFAKLRHLELTGMLPEDDTTTAIDAVARILERSPNLETLTLFFMPEPEPEPEGRHMQHCYEEELLHLHKLKYDEHASVAMPDIELPACLRKRMKEINLVHYQGGMAQRTLAKFLLCNAPVVQEVCGEFASGPLFIQIKLMEEIKGWVMNKSANMMFF